MATYMARSFECKSGLGLHNPGWVSSILHGRNFFWVWFDNIFICMSDHLKIPVPTVILFGCVHIQVLINYNKVLMESGTISSKIK
jgi:hypothetical protein